MPLFISVKSDSSEQVEAGAAESSLRESKGEQHVGKSMYVNLRLCCTHMYTCI